MARRKFGLVKNLMSFIGVEEPRVSFSWISASEGARFADTIRKVTDDVKAVGPKKGLLAGSPDRGAGVAKAGEAS